MFEDSYSIELLGTQAFAYGALVMLGCWLALVVLYLLSKKDSKLLKAAAITGLVALPLGFVLARLMFVLLDPGFAPLMTVKNLFKVTSGGFAMFGALIGAFLAGFLGAKAAGIRTMKVFDLVSLAALLFLVPARLGEGYTVLGVSRPLTTQWLADSFLARGDEYDAYLRTYVLEALIAAILFVILLRVYQKKHRDGKVFTLFCLLFGTSQTLMESLRYDGHLRFSFVGVQQVLSAVLFSLTLIVLAVRLIKRGTTKRFLPVVALISVPLVLAGIVGVEFLIDRSEMGKLVSYGLYLLVLAVPVIWGILLVHQEGKLGLQSNDGAH